MPFPNEHAARLQDPGKYIRFRRQNDAGGSGVDFIFGITRDQKAELQAIRFDAGKFTAAEAKKWLSDHGHTAKVFEPATGERNASDFASRLEDWFPVAATGKFPQGDLTEDIFDQLADTFNPSKHEPPVTLGHIRADQHNDKPSMAWIAGVKRVGNTLFVKARQIWQKFDQMVQEGRFKKRSIGIRKNADGKFFLHHLAFLGSMTPAVEGLPDVYSMNFEDSDPESQVDNYPFDQGIYNQNPDGGNMSDKKYTDEEMTAKLADQKKQLEQEHAEKLKTEKDKAIKEAEEKKDKEFNDNKDKEKARLDHERKMDEYVDAGLKDGSITPAMVKAGLKPFLYSLIEPKEITYTEKDGDTDKEVKTDALTIVKNVIKAFTASPEDGVEDPEGAGEAGSGTTPGGKKKDGDYKKEKKRALELMEEAKKTGKPITFGEALKEARFELQHPEDK